MALTPKEKYNLSKLLARLVREEEDARRYCDDTIGFNSDNIEFKGGAREMWANIIGEADKQDMLEALLEVIVKSFEGNKELMTFCDEIKHGIDRRVEAIARAIKKNECVLFIGPELLQCLGEDNKVESFNRLFSARLVRDLNKYGVYYDEGLKQSLSYIADRFEESPNVASRELGKEAQKFFAEVNASLIPTIFERITKLKFPLIISTNPDNIIEKELAKNQIPFSSGYYDRSNQNRNATAFNDNHTMIYMIFGSFQNPFSILYTDNDRVQFAKNVVKNDPPLPPEIQVALQNKYYLFLGFNFEEWHLKILIDCLGLAKNADRSFALLLRGVDPSNIEYFEKIYKFYFINEKIETFLNEVIQRHDALA